MNILTDISGNGNNATVASSLVSTKDGVQFNGKEQVWITTSTNVLKEAECTVNFRLTTKDITTSSQRVIRSVGANTNRFYLYINGNVLSITRGNNTAVNISNIFNSINTNYNITLYWKAAGYILKVYVNGVNVYDGTYDGIATGGDATLQLGGNAGEACFNGIIKDLRIYNRALTTQEIKDYHNSFNDITLIEDFSDCPADNTTAIVPTGWEKISGSYKVGEHTMANGELVTNGSFTGGTTGWVIGSSWVYNNNNVINNNSGSGANLFQTPILAPNKKYRITLDTIITAGGITVQLGGGTGGYNLIGTITSSGKYVVEGYSYGSNNTLLIQTITGTTPGSIIVDNVSAVEIPPLETFQNGTKYLENVTAGVIAIPSQQAYGTWEFDWYKGADNNDIYIGIASDKITGQDAFGSATGYQINISLTEYIRLTKRLSGTGSILIQTTTSYITNNTWYRIKVTRSTSGVFTVYILGGNFTNWTLVSTTGGNGSNPVTDKTYTTSSYFVLDLDSQDRISNIRIYPWIKV